MHKIYELRDMLCKELEAYGERDDLTTSTLEVIDKLAHAIKNIDKIIEAEGEMEEGYSSRNSYDGMGSWAYAGGGGGGGSSRRSSRYSGRSSYARRRDSMGRYSSRRGYSRADGAQDMVMELRELINEAQDPQIRGRIEQLIGELERA